LKLSDYLASHNHNAPSPSLETRVTRYIINELPVWKSALCFLFYRAVQKVYAIIAAEYPEGVLRRQLQKRWKMPTEALGYHPYKAKTKDEVTVTDHSVSILIFCDLITFAAVRSTKV